MQSYSKLRQLIVSPVQRVIPTALREHLEVARYSGLPAPIRVVRPYSLLSCLNLLFLQELARRLDESSVEGDFVECGVYRGGSGALLGYESVASKYRRRLWLYDSFAGMPEASAADDEYSKSLRGKYVGSEAQTRRLLRRLRVPEDRFRITTGWFDSTLPVAQIHHVALLHVDCDFYAPVRLVLETFYARVQPLGYVVLNDYGTFTGCRRATDEFLAKLGCEVPLTQVDRDAYFFQKPLLSRS